MIQHTMRTSGALTLALAILCTPTVSKAQAASEELAQFRLGMTIAEVRAAASDHAWVELAEEGDVVLSAQAATVLAGQAFDVSVRTQSGAAYEVMLTRHDTSVQSLGECRIAVLAIMGALASTHGPLVPVADPVPSASPQRIRALLPYRVANNTGAALMRLLETPIRHIERLGETRLDFVQNESWSGTGTWMGVRPADGRRPLLIAGGGFGYGDQPPNCGFRATLSRDRAIQPTANRDTAAFVRRVDAFARTLPALDEQTLAPPDRLDTAIVRPALEASEAQRHWTLLNRSPEERDLIPPAGADIVLECVVQRRQRNLRGRGTAWPCWATNPQTPAPLVAMASSIASHTRFSDDDLGSQTDVALLTRLSVHLSLNDLREPPSPNVELLSMNDIVWSRALPPEALSRYFSGGVSQDINIAVPCEIRGDGSLVCWPVDNDERPGRSLAALVRTVVTNYRVSALLSDGSPSAGRWVEMVFNVKFNPPPLSVAGARSKP